MEIVAIVKQFQAEERMMKVVMLAMWTNLLLAIPRLFKKWPKPFSKHEELPQMQVSQLVHICPIVIY